MLDEFSLCYNFKHEPRSDDTWISLLLLVGFFFILGEFPSPALSLIRSHIRLYRNKCLNESFVDALQVNEKKEEEKKLCNYLVRLCNWFHDRCCQSMIGRCGNESQEINSNSRERNKSHDIRCMSIEQELVVDKLRCRWMNESRRKETQISLRFTWTHRAPTLLISQKISIESSHRSNDGPQSLPHS